MSKILIVEDDSKINKMIRTLLVKNNYEVVSAYSGTEALLLLAQERCNLILLDLMLPGLSGEEVLDTVMDKYQIPVICVSARDDIADKIDLIRKGADDYITKPFNNEELLVRVEAVLRRTCNNDTSVRNKNYTCKDLLLESENHVVKIDGNSIDLTVKEYSMLELLLTNPKKVFTKQNIFESVWQEEYIDERAVTVHMSNLRKKLDKDNSDKYIKTVWGIGYRLADD